MSTPTWDDTEEIGPSWDDTEEVSDPNASGGVLGTLSNIMKTVDSYTGAPVRSAIGAAQNTENPFPAYWNQLGEDPSKAPTGRDIAVKAGVSDKSQTMSAADRQAFDEKYNPGWAANVKSSGRKYEDLVSPSPADVAGVALDVAADPVTLIPGVAFEKTFGKGLNALRTAKNATKLKTAEALEGAGTSLYKSGLKKIDQVGARYGKEPVSDLLMQHGITGSSEDVYRQMDQLGDKLLSERTDILKHATRKGAEVDVRRAMSEAQYYVKELRKTDNPEAKKVADMLQGRIDEYLQSASRESEHVLRELPTSTPVGQYREIKGYKPASEELLELPTSKMVDEAKFLPEVEGYHAPTISNPAPGEINNFSGKDLLQTSDPGRLKKVLSEPVLRDSFDEVVSLPQSARYESKYVPNSDVGLVQNPAEVIYGREVPAHYQPGPAQTVIDETERIAGPTPIQTTSWKTRSANKVGDQAWQQIAHSTEGQGFDKALSGGLRSATEESVGKVLGASEQAALKTKNADLGRILTTKERALLDAEQEARKNSVTSVDGILSIEPMALAAKKTADFSKTTRFRTVGGKALRDVAARLRQSPQLATLEEKNPKAFLMLVKKMEDILPQASSEAAENPVPDFNKTNSQEALVQKAQGTKYAQALQSAAQRGEKAVAATHFVLQQQDPEYRKLMDEGNENDDVEETNEH